MSHHKVAILGVGPSVHDDGPPEARIAAVGAHQRNLISRRQLRQAGIGRGAIARRIGRGTLIAVNAQVLAIGSPSPMPLQEETAALLAIRDGARLSHQSACALWGLMRRPEQVHVLVPGHPPQSLAGVEIHRTRSLIAADCRIHKGLPVTSPARAVFDSADIVPARVLERAVSEGAVTGLIRPGELDDVLQRGRGRRGVALLREIVASSDIEVTRSEAEDRMLALIDDADVLRPLVNASVLGYEVDLLWPDARLIIEIDGYRFHANRIAFERDRLRDARLQAAGYLVMRVTWRQLTREPLAVIARLAGALALRTSGGR